MMKFVKIAVLIIVAAMQPACLLAQVLADVQNNFNKYSTYTLQEKLFVHTDKNAYTAGELMWFKIYNVDGTDHQALDFSKVVYIELLNNNQTVMRQAKIAMNNGAGNGSIYIPLTLSTGNYTLRAYTSWMKNFDPGYYFSKQITVINPLKSPDKQTASNAPEYDIQFFPEGGNMVNGIPGVIAFKVVDKWGNGVNFKGAVINKQNDTLARFEPLKFGMGHFSFMPGNNDTYRAVIKIGDKMIRKDLPQANSSGYVMRLSDAGNGKISVTIRTDLPDAAVYLFAHTGNSIKLAQTATTNNGTAIFDIDKTKLGDGVSHLTIFNSNKQPVCERLYFKRPAKRLLINTRTDMQQYAARKKVTVDIGTKNNHAEQVAADLSISVYAINPLQHPRQGDIQSYVWLTADLKGNIESPEYYFDHAGADVDEGMDNLMLTQGWSRFKWNNILNGKQPAFNFLPEHNGPIITAQATSLLNGKPAKDVIAYLAIPGKRLQMYTASSDSLGRMMFNMKDFYGPGEIVVQTNSGVDTNYRIDVKSPFSERYAKQLLPPFVVTPDMEPVFKDQSLGMQVQNIYNAAKTRRFYEPEVDSMAFYGPPFKTYLLDNYTRFSTLEEVFREYVSEVNVRIAQKNYQLLIHTGMNFLDGENPMVMLDGVPFFNINKVMAFDPLKLRKLEVVPFTYYYGPSNAEGILSFSTYKGDLGGIEIDPHAVVMDYEGLELQREFYSPVYDTEKSLLGRVPDYRNVLYWSPDVLTGKQGKSTVTFYTGDKPGKYIGVVQGLTADGECGSSYFTFDVK